MPKNSIAETCSIDGGCENYTFYYVVAVIAAIIIGGLIFINMNKSNSNDKEDAHVHTCDGDKCYN